MNNSDNKIKVFIENANDIAKIEVSINNLQEQIIKFVKTMIYTRQEIDEKTDINIEFNLIIDETGELVLLGGSRQEYFHYIKVSISHKGNNNYVASIKHTEKREQVSEKTTKIQSPSFLTSNIKIDRENYMTPAGSKTPGLVIFLMDVSGSMGEKISPNLIRIDAVSQLIQKIAVKMVQRSTKGAMIAPRYNVAMFAYSSQVIDLLGGIKSIDELAKMGVPQLTTLDMTDTSSAFSVVKDLLISEIPKYSECPAPIILHITDGEYNGSDPTPIAEEICKMNVKDGNVLLVNIYLKYDPRNDRFFSADNADWIDVYEEKLFNMSSVFPDNYRSVYAEFGFQVPAGAKMYFRGYVPEILELLMPMSGATPVTRG